MIRAAGILAVVAVLAAAGPVHAQGLAVSHLDYDYGDAAVVLPSLPLNAPVEMRGRAFFPTAPATTPTASALPVVVLLHGRHATCETPGGGVRLRWPCVQGEMPVPSHLGYDYLAEALASRGMIVISVSANGINAVDNLVKDLGAMARAELIDAHLKLLAQANAGDVAPFGTQLVGRVDLTRVGTMGHSRGGEGVVQHYLHNQAQGSPFGIQAVLALAPINVNGLVPAGVPLAVTLGYCDGDVLTLEGAAFYDRARYAVPADTAPKHLIVAYGANHNFFNTVWSPSTHGPGAADDWDYIDLRIGPDPYCSENATKGERLTEEEQQDLLAEVGTAFFARYLQNDQTLNDLRGDAPLTGGSLGAPVRVTYQPPADVAESKLLHTFTATDSPTTNNLGSPFFTNITGYDVCGGTDPTAQLCAGDMVSEIGLSGVEPNREAHALRLRFNAMQIAAETVPASDQDWSAYANLSFRASLDFASTPATVVEGEIAIRDRHGKIAAVLIGDATDALTLPPGDTDGILPRALLNGIRIPLSDFAGLDLTQIDRIWFSFQGPGALLMTDLMLTN